MDSNWCRSAYLPNTLLPGQAGSLPHHRKQKLSLFISPTPTPESQLTPAVCLLVQTLKMYLDWYWKRENLRRTTLNFSMSSAQTAFSIDLLALVSGGFWLVSAVEEATAEELNSDDGEDELEEDVHDENVGHVLQRVYHTVEHRLGIKMTRWRSSRKGRNKLTAGVGGGDEPHLTKQNVIVRGLNLQVPQGPVNSFRAFLAPF